MYNLKTYNVINLNGNLPYNISELLKKEYGKSKYFLSKGGVNVDLERVIDEKYFITYSWMNGNKSAFYFIFTLENENKNPISNHNISNLRAVDNFGNEYEPLNYSFEDFPKDEPLKYKEIINMRFLPFDDDVKSITISFSYNGNDYVFKNIEI